MTKSVFGSDRLAVWIWCGALLLVYPARWTGGAHFDALMLFGRGALALLALWLLCRAPGRITALREAGGLRAAALLALAVPVLIHFVRYGNLELLLNGLYLLALPLFGMIYARALKRPLLWLTILLGAADFCVILSQCAGQKPWHGLTGNWNWSATLLLAGSTAAVWVAASCWRWPAWRRRAAMAAAAAAVFLLYHFGWTPAFFPRGTLLGGVAAGIVAAAFLMRGRWRLIPLVLLAALLAGLAAAILADPVRRELSEAALRVFREYPVFGCGAGRFESAAAPLIDPAYYDLPTAADRHPHPHNELLYLLASFGVWGLVYAAGLLALAGRGAAAALGRRDAAAETLVLLVAMIGFHGLVDVPLIHWPTDSLFFVALGVLAGSARKLPETPLPEFRLRVWRMAAWFCFFLLGWQLIAGGVSGFFARRAMLAAGKEAARKDWAESRRWKLTEQNIYKGAMCELFDRKNTDGALELLALLPSAMASENYQHNNGLTARALAASGRLEESLPWFEREQRNFPRSKLNLYYHEWVLRRLKRDAEADRIAAELRKNLEFRGLSRVDLPRLMANPELDWKGTADN